MSKDNAVFFYGGSKNNHYTTSTHETSNWYKVGFKDALAKDEQIIDISSGNHFTALVTSAGNLYGVGDYILSAVNKAPHAGEAKFTKLNMLDHYKALRVWASRAKYCQAIIVSIENMQTQERYLVSIG